MGNGASSNQAANNSNNQSRQSQTSNRSQGGQPQTPRGATPSRSQQGFKEVEMSQSGEGSGQGQAQAGSSQPGTPQQPRDKKQTNKKNAEYKDDDIVFETFTHRNGRVYTCLYRNGMRYYLDNWHTDEWQVFPMRWYNEGTLTTDTLVRGDHRYDVSAGETSNQQQQQQPQEHRSHSTGRTQRGEAGGEDDREGYIKHPSRGKLPTYIFEEKRNVHYYYDEDYGQWVKLPLHWELLSDTVKPLIEVVAEALPTWKDKLDILASLRASNYNPDDCIDTFLAWNDKGPNFQQSDMKVSDSKGSKSGSSDVDVKKLAKDLELARKNLSTMKQERDKAMKRAEEISEKFNAIQAESQVAMAHYEAMQSRPKTPARPKTPQEKKRQNQIDLDIVSQVNEQAITLHKAYNGLQTNFQRFKADIGEYIVKIIEAMKQMKKMEGSQANELEELRSAYRRECVQRKLLYNKLQEMRGNIRVFARCRHDNRVECVLKFPSNEEIAAPPQGGSKKSFKFDKVFTPKSTQAEVFEDALPIVTSCVDGYNVCILAYGQTGSGKTHTMMGPPNDAGVNIRAIKELLKICNERDKIKYTLKCSIVEIYNEMVQDLLSKDVQTVEVRAQGKTIQMPNLTELAVNTLDDIQTIIDKGNKNRSVASTKMNSTSSRSHLVMMIAVEGQDTVSKAVTKGILTLCDLAGSERIGKTEAEGQRLVEAAAINKSLSALGQVFAALRTNQLHVPYRNSKLTHILQPCLSGDAKACLFVAVSPAASNIQESISTLQFGSNARQVALGQAKQNISKGPQS